MNIAEYNRLSSADMVCRLTSGGPKILKIKTRAVVLRQFISLNVIVTFVIFAVVALPAAVDRLILCFAVDPLNVAAGLMVADQLSDIAYPSCSYCCL